MDDHSLPDFLVDVRRRCEDLTNDMRRDVKYLNLIKSKYFIILYFYFFYILIFYFFSLINNKIPVTKVPPPPFSLLWFFYLRRIQSVYFATNKFIYLDMGIPDWLLYDMEVKSTHDFMIKRRNNIFLYFLKSTSKPEKW